MNPKKSTPPLLLIGGGADDADVRYAARFTAPDPFLFLRHRGERIVLVSPLELGRALRVKPGLVCLTAEDLQLPRAARRDFGAQAAALLRHRGLSSVSVSRECPAGVLRGLEKKGLRVTVLKKQPFPEREIKRADEIKALRVAQRAAVSAMKAATGLISLSEPGPRGRLTHAGKILTAERVRFEIETALLRANCRAEDIIVACGDQAVDPHERGYGPLTAGVPIVLDIFPRAGGSGYWGDITRTVARGPVSPERRKLYRTVLAAQKNALARVAPGVESADIHQGICDHFTDAGYETGLRDGIPQGFIHSTGHGVGLEIHESPSISPVGGPLRVGQVITIEPGLYYRGLGGVRIEDTVVVTETGCSLLGRCRKVFEL